MEHVLVTGANGQLGSELKVLKDQFENVRFFFANSNELDIVNKTQLQTYINHHNITLIINCAAYTNVDGAETQQQLAMNVNCLGVKNIAELASEKKIKLIHISTDYVFNGASSIPYKEEDIPNAQNVYGATKLAGEQAILAINPPKTIIIRTSWLYSSFGSNFVKTMLRLTSEKEEVSVVNDQIGSPTYAADLAKFIFDIRAKLDNKVTVIYHFSNSGFCSWYEFANKIVAISGSSCKLKPVSSTAFKSVAKRPKYSILNTEKVETTFQIKLSHWENSLKKCIKKIV